MDSLQTKVAGFAGAHKMFLPDARVLAAVSGGPDSVALVRVLACISGTFGFELAVVHVNHALRGDESKADERFVIDLAEELNIPVFVCDGQLFEDDVRNGCSYEEAARNIRRELFVDAADGCDADTIALGHHMDDQAETFLMRLMRGSGVSGLASIAPINSFEGLRLVRPLLCLSRAEIEEWLGQNNFAYRTDESNKDTSFTRNRVRHTLMPQIANGFNPNIIRSLASTAEQMRMLDAWSGPLLDKKYRRCVRPCFKGTAAVLDMEKFVAEDEYVRFAVVKKICEQLRGKYSTVDFAHVQRICALLCAPDIPAQKGELPGISFYVEPEKTVFWCSDAKKDNFAEMFIDPARPGRCRRKGIVLDLEELEPGQRPEECFKTSPEGWTLSNFGRRVDFYAALDVDKLKDGLVLRTARPGESMCPTGMKGKIKVKDVLTTMKVPAPFRAGFPVLASGDGIVWIPGYRIDVCSGIRADTKRTIKIRLGLHMPLWLC